MVRKAWNTLSWGATLYTAACDLDLRISATVVIRGSPFKGDGSGIHFSPSRSGLQAVAARGAAHMAGL
jgi:hypothetical protein